MTSTKQLFSSLERKTSNLQDTIWTSENARGRRYCFLLPKSGKVINTMRGLWDEVQEVMIVQKVLRSLSARFNPKVSAIEDRENIDTLKLVELHGLSLTTKWKHNI